MLFGTPHKGLSTDELLRMVQSDLEDTVEPEQREYRELRLKLLKQLEEGSSFLEEQREALRPLCEELQLRIFSFYETEWTSTVQQVASLPMPLGRWLNGVQKSQLGGFERDGAKVKMVKRGAALLYLPNEIAYPVKNDHRNMVKFADSTDDTYKIVVSRIKECLKAIGDANEARMGLWVIVPLLLVLLLHFSAFRYWPSWLLPDVVRLSIFLRVRCLMR
jgi:hypothetical protein